MQLVLIMVVAFLLAQSAPSILKPLILRIKSLTGRRRCRPLDCESCLSFWFTLALGMIGTTVFFAILMSIVVYRITCRYEYFKITGE